MTKHPEQLFIAGTEPAPDPAKNPMTDLRIFEWLEAKDEKRRTADRCKDREHLLMVDMQERGLDRYPYIDSLTGKKRYFVADKTPKPKTIAAFEPKKPKAKKRDPEEIAKREATEANSIEQRRVPRGRVTAELAEAEAKVRAADNAGPKIVRGDGDPDGYVGGDDGDDPFGRVRKLMDDSSERALHLTEPALTDGPFGETEH